MRARVLDWAAACAALGAAAFLYLGWRDGLRLHEVWPDLTHAIRAFGTAHPLPTWVRLSLPDALWQYAFCSIVISLWRGVPWTGKKLLFCSLPAFVGLGAEGGQRLGLLPGTYDHVDAALSLCAVVFAFALHGSLLRRAPESTNGSPLNHNG